jgi:hypothetical protein
VSTDRAPQAKSNDDKACTRWFARRRNPSNAANYLNASLLVFRTWFLNETTRMNPNMNYAEGQPGQPRISDGAATGVIHMARKGAMFNDCVALFRRSDSWTVQDETAWQNWMREWVAWLTQPISTWVQRNPPPSGPHPFGYVEAFLTDRGNHATWMWAHTLAMAKAAGWQRLALEWMRQVRSGFPSALVNQIEASGKMPKETARSQGATYARFNLEAIFILGGVIDTICRDWACDSDARFRWDAPMVSEGSAKWIMHRDADSICPSGMETVGLHTTTDVVSEEACKQLCLDGGNRSTRLGTPNSVMETVSCNTFSIRYVRGQAYSCYLRACGPLGSGAAWMEAVPVTDGSLYQTHAFVDPPANGTGSVKRAVDYFLPYALGDKDWHDDHPNQLSSEGKDWSDMGALFHQAAVFIDAEAYHNLSHRVDADFAQNEMNLVLPVQLCSGTNSEEVSGTDGEEVFGKYCLDGSAASTPLPSSTVFLSSTPIPTSRTYSLAPTRDFSTSSCAETRTWVQLRPLLVEQAAFTGGASAPLLAISVSQRWGSLSSGLITSRCD